MSMKNSNGIIGNRTRDVPACSAVPQPTAPPRAPYDNSPAVFLERPLMSQPKYYKQEAIMLIPKSDLSSS